MSETIYPNEYWCVSDIIETYHDDLITAMVVPAEMNGFDPENVLDYLDDNFGECYVSVTVKKLFEKFLVNWWLLGEWEFIKLWELHTAKYNPIENYDRIEDRTSTDENCAVASAESMSNGTGRNTAETTAKQSKKPYDSQTYTESEKTDDNTSASTENQTNSETNSTSHSTGNHVETSRIHGNIGVTTSAAMFREQAALVRTFNVYAAIADSFASRFIVAVW